jgi:protein TonB
MLRTSIALALASALLSLPAGAAGKADLQVYFQSTLASASYQQKVFAKVARAYRQPRRGQEPAPGSKAVVQAVIGKDGKLLSSILSLPSGSKAWDDAALAALQKARFPRLPADFAQPTVEVHFHFAWSGR